MRKSTSQSSATILRARIKEGSFILFCALTVFVLVALLSYNSADPGWSRATGAANIANAAGAIGAWSADLLLSFFGLVAYLVPFLLASTAILIFKSYSFEQRSRALWLLHLCGILFIVASTCALVNLSLQTKNIEFLPGTAGGIIGSLIANSLQPRFNIPGSYLILSAFLLIGITIGTGMSAVRLLELLGRIILDVLSRAANGFVYAGQTIWQRLSFKRKQRPTKIVRHEEERRSNVKLEARTARQPLREPEIDVLPMRPKPAIAAPKNPRKNTNGALPDLSLLEPAPASDPKKHYTLAALENLSREVEERLLDFGAEVKVVAVCPGPIITRFEMTLAPGLKVSKITGLAKDLARSLSVRSVRVVEVIPGKSVVGLEIPNKHREMVKLREVLESPQYQEKEGPLNLALGKDISGVPVVVNLASMPHLLVAGTTGSGKSVGVNAMLLSLLFKATPADLRLILIDPKMLELSIYDGISHLLTPVVTDMNDAANALRWCVAEMERRYQIMAALGVRNLAGYNSKVMQAITDNKAIGDPLWDPNSGKPQDKLQKLPSIVVIIDEFADMMMVVGKKVEELIARIAQKARAAGIHMILATQRPSVDVITGLIKANVPTRIAFQVSSRIDSRTILDQQGAEQLIGHGDMLYLAPGAGIPTRVHGAFVSDEEVHAVVSAIKQTGVPDYIEEIANSANLAVPGIDAISDSGEQDPLYDEAVAIVTETRKASISYLQRRLKIGYNRSARLIEAMEAVGVVSEVLSNGSREVLAFDVSRN